MDLPPAFNKNCPTLSRFLTQLQAQIRRDRFLFLLFAFALILRLGVIVFYQYPTFLEDRRLSLNDREDDQRTYSDLSESMIGRGEFSVPIVTIGEFRKHPGFQAFGYRPPLYPLLLMIVRGFAGGHMLSIR